MNKKIEVFLAVIALIFSAAANAGEGRVIPFETVPSELPAGFVGNDLKKIISAIQKDAEKLGIIKDEFTSKSDFLKKSADAVAQLNKNGKYVFVRKQYTSSGYAFLDKYDPDGKGYTINVLTSTMDSDHKTSLVGIALESDRKVLGGYDGVNSFGNTQ